MKTNKALLNWIINLVLWVGFLTTFFLDLTGLDVHQWLGLALGALAGYHLALHWKWVQAVGQRFFGSTSLQARAYYLLDAAILTGFALIVGTGVLISTWLGLQNIAFLVSLHETASILTLLLVVIKLGLHWRMIVQAVLKYLPAPQWTRQPTLAPVTAAARITRRSFLSLMGVVGVAAGAAITNVNASAPASAVNTMTSTLPNTPTTAAQSSAASATGSASTTTTASTTCVLRCNKRCSYPGRCRRYTDSNKNGKCDLGECL
jgi:hypothetical protein